MKMYLGTAVLILIGLIFGCEKQGDLLSRPVKLTEEKFPESMVGIWECQNKKIHWGIKFEPDGSIKKIIHYLAGPVNLEEGSVSETGPENSYYVFIMGPVETEYNPKDNIVKVDVILEHFEMSFPAGILEGHIRDTIWGPVSDDGKTWNVEWVSYLWVEGADAPDPNIVEANPDKIVFKKKDYSDKKKSS